MYFFDRHSVCIQNFYLFLWLIYAIHVFLFQRLDLDFSKTPHRSSSQLCLDLGGTWLIWVGLHWINWIRIPYPPARPESSQTDSRREQSTQFTESWNICLNSRKSRTKESLSSSGLGGVRMWILKLLQPYSDDAERWERNSNFMRWVRESNFTWSDS